MEKTLTQTQSQPARENLQRQRQAECVLPPVNITATHDQYLLEVEMPGVSKEGLEVSVEGNELSIVGHRHPEEAAGEVLYRESYDADFRRVFEIGSDIDTGRISAEMHQGILKLRLPKAERVKPRTIPIQD